MNIESIRRDFDVFKKYVYLNTAVFSPLPKITIESIERYLSIRKYGITEIDEEDIINGAREKLAKIMNASCSEIAFTLNTGHGLNIVANGIDFEKDDNVIVVDSDFPSVVYPFLNKGIEIRYIKSREGVFSLRDFEKVIDDKTRVVAVSHVQFTSGYRANIRELVKIAHEHDAITVIDVAQSLGAVNVDVKDWNVDVVVGIGYKWLMSPTGVGFLYVKEERLSDIKPSLPGWASVVDSDYFSTRSLNYFIDARKYETGNLCLSCIVGLNESLRYVGRLGTCNVEERILELSRYVIKRLEEFENVFVYTPKDKCERAGIVFFKFSGINSSKVVEELKKYSIIVSERRGGIRVSTHFYNTQEDIDKMFSIIDQIM